jgi:hypothetical protein
MPKYRLKKDHFLQAKKPGTQHDSKDRWAKEPQLHEQGSTIDWDGPPSLHMEPLDKEAGERVEQRVADWNARKQKAQASRAAMVGWSPNYAANMERIITRSTEPDADPMPATGSKRSPKKAA